MTEPEVLYWDVELKTSKWVTPTTNYIVQQGGVVTDTFNHDDSAIYLLRVRMSIDLAEDIRKQKGVMSVERPPRMRCQKLTRTGECNDIQNK